jgi:hypothetical protein
MSNEIINPRDVSADHSALEGPAQAGQEALRRAQEALLSANEQLVTLVRRHPVPCVLGAAAVGYFVGRAASQRWLK